MKELKFKNSLFAILYIAIFYFACLILSATICILITYLFEESKDLILDFIVFGVAFFVGFFIALLSILFSKTVIITTEEIKMCRGKKVKWIINKDEIEECIYNEMKWYGFLIPLSSINAYSLQFKLKGKGISRHYCSLSLVQVKKIKEAFDYPIRNIDKIYKQ